MRMLLLAALLSLASAPSLDVTPPVVSMNFVDGNQIIQNTVIGILVWASDDVGVVAVDVWTNGELACHLTEPSPNWPEPQPYECVAVMRGPSPYTIVAQACDAAGNCASATAHPVRVKVKAR